MATFIENAPEKIVAAAKKLLEKGLVEGTSGNISARMEDGNIACTPSSLDYEIMTRRRHRHREPGRRRGGR